MTMGQVYLKRDKVKREETGEESGEGGEESGDTVLNGVRAHDTISLCNETSSPLLVHVVEEIKKLTDIKKNMESRRVQIIPAIFSILPLEIRPITAYYTPEEGNESFEVPLRLSYHALTSSMSSISSANPIEMSLDAVQNKEKIDKEFWVNKTEPRILCDNVFFLFQYIPFPSMWTFHSEYLILRLLFVVF